MKGVLGAMLAGTTTYAYSSTISVHDVVVENVTVRVPGLAAARRGTRLVVMADFHAGHRVSIGYIDRAIQMAVALRPDFILLPGDLVDSSDSHLEPLCHILGNVAMTIPIYASTGNHDFGPWNYSFADRVCGALERAGVRMLRNAWHQPEAGPGQLCFVGVEDLWSSRLNPAILTQVPADASVILLSHNPDSYELVQTCRWHLMVSGHTHGGQVCIPGIGPLHVPVEHRERAAGLFHLDASQPDRSLYVTRGVGHFVKIRLSCPPEITCITLEAAEA